MPGIYAYKGGATVHFQDYNKEVLDCCTAPSVLLNTPREDWALASTRCQFFCGDWSGLLSMTLDRYDAILTAETIYDPQNHQCLYDVMKATLKSDGEIYLAAKSYYFGVGGGIEQFRQRVANDNHFSIAQCWTNDDGIFRTTF